MKKHFHLAWLFVLLPTVLFILVFVTRGPRYKGRTASQWLERMKMPPKDAESDPGLKAIEAIGSPAVPVLVRELKSRNEAARFRAAWALGNLGAAGSNAVPELVKLIDDPSTPVQGVVMQALASIGTDRDDLVPNLLSKLTNTAPLVSVRAAELLDSIERNQRTLGKWDEADDLVFAEAFLHALSPNGRIRSIPKFVALAQNGEPVRGAFERLLNDEIAWVREETVRALKKHRLPEEKIIPSTLSANLAGQTWVEF